MPFDIPAGAQVEYTIRFRANLLRGTYLLSAVLVDSERRWGNLRLATLASFVVNERESYAGCVAVDPEATVALDQTEAPLERPSAAMRPAR